MIFAISGGAVSVFFNFNLQIIGSASLYASIKKTPPEKNIDYDWCNNITSYTFSNNFIEE